MRIHDRESSPEPDLHAFGFSGDDAWLRVFGDAARTPPLGRLGPYELLAEVARGGQGIVYRARSPRDGRTVAIKRLRADAIGDPRARRRFEREAESAARLEHPGIVRIIESGVVDDDLLLVMEWIDGVPVTEWAASDGRGGRRTTRAILDVFTQVCEAIGHAHQRGVIHRDLKPGNILVRRDPNAPAADESVAVTVLDFGVACWRDERAAGEPACTERLTRTEQFVGTPAFAAPEQLRGRAAAPDVRTDVYALGVVLFRMLTGRLPYDTDGTLVDVLRAICEREPLRPSSLRRDVPSDLDAIVVKALEKDPARRYPGVDALAADIRRLLAGEAVSAHPPHLGYRLRKFVGRHRAAVAFFAVALTAVLVGGVLVTMLALRLVDETRAAAAARADEADARRAAERVAAFLREMLADARPGRGGGDARVLEMLQAAQVRAATELADEPAVAAEVYLTIGQTYRSLWLWREAIDPLERAVSRYRAVGGADGEPLARALVLLGTCLSNTADPRCAAVQREALARRQAACPGDHPLIAESMMRLGYALYRGCGDAHSAEAREQLDAALAMYRRLHGQAHRDVACCLHNIGYMHWRQGRLELALSDYEQALTILRGLDRGDDPYLIECLSGYASLLDRVGRTSEAIAAWQELRPLLAKNFGNDWLEEPTLRLAQAHLKLDECDAAAELYAAAAELIAGRVAVRSPQRAGGVALAAERLQQALRDSAGGGEPVRVPPSEDAWPSELLPVADGLARIHLARGWPAAADIGD